MVLWKVYIPTEYKLKAEGCKSGYQKIMLTTNLIMGENFRAGMGKCRRLLEEVLPKYINLSFPSSTFGCNAMGLLQMQHTMQKLEF